MKRVMCLILTITMLISVLPLSVFSWDTSNSYQTITFGRYPKTKVTNSNTIADLETCCENLDYIKGYSTVNGKTITYYDVCSGSSKYRGIVDSDNNNITWFEFYAIQWIILDSDNGILLSQDILDVAQFSNTENERIEQGQTVNPNQFEYSCLKSFLNDLFYETAFSAAESDDILTFDDGSEVSLLSEEEYQDFTGIPASTCTGYANQMRQSNDKEIKAWWLRSASEGNTDAKAISSSGSAVQSYSATQTDIGVRPLIKVNSSVINSTGSTITSGSNPAEEPTIQNTVSESEFNGTFIDATSDVRDTFYDGDGTFESKYKISSVNDLIQLQIMVNQGLLPEDKMVYFELCNNIDLKGFNWEPIGYNSSAPFRYSFDGNNHVIKNFYVAVNDSIPDNTGIDEFYHNVTYIGFFGYVDGGHIGNFGISDYLIGQSESKRNTCIGSLVGKMANGATVTNCYADGDICCTVSETCLNPLDRYDMWEMTLSPDTNDSDLENIYSGHPNGQGLIIDLSAQDSCTLNKTLKINDSITAVRFIGKQGAKYENLNIVIGASDTYDFLIELVDMDFVGTITCLSARDIYIECTSQSTISAPQGKTPLNLPDSNLYIIGNSELNIYGGQGDIIYFYVPLAQDGCSAVICKDLGISGQGTVTIKGGRGSDGIIAGVAGKNGGTAVLCDTLSVNSEVTVNVTGGDGGNGENGSNGADSSNDSTMGGAGKTGGKGGNGGTAVICNLLSSTIAGNASYCGGNGGNGGQGGNGGCGCMSLTANISNGGNGGTGGQGGNGGDGIKTLYGYSGQGGNGGDGGKGGEGGKGAPDKGVWFIKTPYGLDGGNGGNGGSCGFGGKGSNNGEIGNWGAGNNGGAGTYKTFGAFGSNCSRTGATGKPGLGAIDTVTYNNHTYVLFYGFDSATGTTKTWKEAKEFAESIGGHLATVTSEQENTALVNVLTKQDITKYTWIGATDEGHEGVWEWVTGEPFSFTFWASKQPDNGSNSEHYLQYWEKESGYRWNDNWVDSVNTYAFFVEISSPETRVFSYGNHEYQIVAGINPDTGKGYTWNQAKAYAENIGGHLATIDSEQERTALNNAIKNAEITSEIWIAPSDNTDENATRNAFIVEFEKAEATVIEGSDHPLSEAILSSFRFDVGGFVGEIGEGCTVSQSAVIVDRIEIEGYHEQMESIGTFAGVCYGTADTVISVKRTRDKNGNFVANTKLSGSGKQIQAATDVAYLTRFNSGDETVPVYFDAQGLLYQGAFLPSATLNNERAVIGKSESHNNTIVFPTCVFDGHFINPVTQIQSGIFSGCSTINSIVIGDNVTYLGNSAFAGSSLSSVSLGSGISVIYYNTFKNCANLKSITLSGTVKEIHNCAFEGCTSLTEFTVPNSVEYLGSYIVSDCSELKSLTVPYLGISVDDCSENAKLARLLQDPSSENYFDCLEAIEKVTVTDVAKSIANSAFSGVPNLTTVIIGDGVKSIGNNAFANCEKLSAVTIGNRVETVGKYAFSNCKSLTKFSLPDSVKTVGVGLLQGCTGISEIEIGAGLTEIPDKGLPFGLEKSFNSTDRTYSVSENKNYMSESGALYQCITYTANNEEKTVPIKLMDAPKTTDGNFSVPETVIHIGSYALAYSTIEKFEHGHIRAIDSYAFFGCESLTTVSLCDKNDNIDAYDENGKLKKLKITEDITIDYPKVSFSQEIGSRAFAQCSKLNVVSFLDNPYLRFIADEAFADIGQTVNCVSLGKNIEKFGTSVFTTATGAASMTKVGWIEVDKENPNFVSEDGVLYQIDRSNHSAVLKFYPSVKRSSKEKNSDPAKDFYLPQEVGEMPIVKIAARSFQYASDLKNVVLADRENNITVTVYDYAFANSNIETLTIGKGIKIDKDQEINFLENCNYLTDISVSDDNESYSEYQHDGVLYNKGLTTLFKYPAKKTTAEYTVPSSVTRIAANAFSYSQGLYSLIIKDNKDNKTPLTIGYQSFYGCSNLSYIFFNHSTLEPSAIGENAFRFFGDSDKKINLYYSSDVKDFWTDADRKDKYPKTVILTECSVLPEQIEDSSDYYHIVVLDNEGVPLEGIHVTLSQGDDNIDSDTTVMGIRSFMSKAGFSLVYDTPYSLSVVDSTGTFYPFDNDSLYLDKETHITYVTLSRVPTLSGVSVSYTVGDISSKVQKTKPATEGASNTLEYAVSAIYHAVADDFCSEDISTETATVNKWITDEIDLQLLAAFDSGYSLESYRIIQSTDEGDKTLKDVIVKDKPDSDTVILDSNSNKVTAKITTALTLDDQVVEEKPLYAVITIKDNKGNESVIKKALNLKIIDANLAIANNFLDSMISTEKIKLTIDKSIPVIGGTEVKIDNPLAKKLWVNYEIGSDYIKLMFGDENMGEHLKGGYDYDAYSDLINNEKIKESNKQWDLKYKVGGYAKFIYKGRLENGNPDFAIETGITGKLKFKLSDGVTLDFVIPVRLEYELTLTGTIKLVVTIDNELYDEASQTQGFNYDLDFIFKGELDGYAGIGCKLVSVGVYSNITMNIIMDILPQFGLNRWDLSGDFGAYAKYDGLFVHVKKKWSLFKDLLGWDTTWVIYDKTKGGWFPATEEEVQCCLLDPNNYELVRCTYNLMESNGSDDMTLAEKPYSFSSPKIVNAGDKTYIFYQDCMMRKDYYDEATGQYIWYGEDGDNYDEQNYQKIVYRILDENGTMSDEVYILDDNGYADGAFDAYYDGTDVVVLYSQLNEKLTDMFCQDDIESYMKLFDIRAKHIGNTQAQQLTSDNSYDLNMHLGVVNGKLTAAWIKNASNSMLGQGMNSIMYSVYENGNWSSAEEIVADAGTVTDFEIGNHELVYIVDTDGDINTSTTDLTGNTSFVYNDKLIMEYSFANQTVTQLSETEDSYFDIGFLDGVFTYLCNGSVYSLDDINIDSEEKVPTLSASSLPENYKVLTDENGNAFAIVYVHSEEQENTSTSSEIMGIFKTGNTWGEPIKLKDYQGKYIDDYDASLENGKIILSVLTSSVEDTAQGNRFETVVLELPSAFELGEPDIDYETVKKNTDISIIVPIKSNSSQSISLAKLEESIQLTQNNTAVPYTVAFCDQDGSKIEGELTSGQKGFIKLTFNSGEVSENGFTLSAQGADTSIKLWYSDISVSAKQVQIGNAPHILVYAENKGVLQGTGTLAVNINGKTQNIGYVDLAPGEYQYYTVKVRDLSLSEDDCLVEILCDIDEHNYADNTTELTLVFTRCSEQCIYDSGDQVAATCTEKGHTLYTCQACGQTKKEYNQNEPEPTGHDLLSCVHEATCTQFGYTEYCCRNCDYSYIANKTEVLKHEYQASVTPATCCDKGFTTYTCVHCSHSYVADYTDVIPHSYSSETTEPTCIFKGYTTYTCEHCHYSYIGNITEKTNHVFSDTWTIDISATEQHTGEKSHHCLTDGCSARTDIQTIPQLSTNADFGICGENGEHLTWTMNTVTGTLTIRGSGNMQNYTAETAPWKDYCDGIQNLVLEGGITVLSDTAFFDCSLTQIYGYRGFDGERYAEENSIPFTAIGFGDVNANGKQDSNDYILIRMIYLGLNEASIDAYCIERADINNNGVIDSNDYLKLRYAVLNQSAKSGTVNQSKQTPVSYRKDD